MDGQAARNLVVFHTVLADEIGAALLAWLDEPSPLLARALWDWETSLQDHLIDRLLHDDNAFARAAAAGRLTPDLLDAARADLRILQALFALRPERAPAFRPAAADGLAARLAESSDWAALAEPLAEHIRTHGAGDLGRYHAFRWENGRLTGIGHPDPISLADLIGHDDARTVVLRNTGQFLQGLPANNLLLYGDRGTGKSSTVKALVHEYGPRGLRIVEVNRKDLGQIGDIIRCLRARPQRFILYLDDLSFENFEQEYKSFKAMLEGSLERRPENVLVYATTNRRHLVRERWSDRHPDGQDEVHPRDSLQEMTSLSDRFGMTVIFATPDQDQYLQIVESMAAKLNIPLPVEEVRQLALQWAMWHNGRSGRTARQFIDDLSGRLGIGH